jgi:hypothetical protein
MTGSGSGTALDSQKSFAELFFRKATTYFLRATPVGAAEKTMLSAATAKDLSKFHRRCDVAPPVSTETATGK